ncbi:MAG: hypothetical protein Q7S44_02100 [bacterium]|nr:hypothetical protein [bacterium]
MPAPSGQGGPKTCMKEQDHQIDLGPSEGNEGQRKSEVPQGPSRPRYLDTRPERRMELLKEIEELFEGARREFESYRDLYQQLDDAEADLYEKSSAGMIGPDECLTDEDLLQERPEGSPVTERDLLDQPERNRAKDIDQESPNRVNP